MVLVKIGQHATVFNSTKLANRWQAKGMLGTSIVPIKMRTTLQQTEPLAKIQGASLVTRGPVASDLSVPPHSPDMRRG